MLSEAEHNGAGYPTHVKREFERYLRCGHVVLPAQHPEALEVLVQLEPHVPQIGCVHASLPMLRSQLNSR